MLVSAFTSRQKPRMTPFWHAATDTSHGACAPSLSPTVRLTSRWREIRACNDNACGESKSQDSHDRLLDLTFLIAATDPKAPIY